MQYNYMFPYHRNVQTFPQYYPTCQYYPSYAIADALRLIVESVNSEREDELFYDYLLSVAPKEDRDIITSIRDDERKHGRMFRQIFLEVTGMNIPPGPEPAFQEPASYCDGIRKAIFGELGAVEKYRRILFGFEFLPYRNMITEIYTDELKHATKWNFLYSVNCT